MTEWRPRAGVDVLRRRAALLDEARAFFAARGVLAVDTPALAGATVTDPHIDSLRTTDGAWLCTSPEFAMKRLLAAGFPDIYSICRVFRGGESGRRHLREFTMIEWYRRDFGMRQMIDETLALIGRLLGRGDYVDGARCIDYRDLFVETLGVDPDSAPLASLVAAAGADARLETELGGHRDTWLELLFATRIAAALPADRPTVVLHFPASQAALARLCPGNPSVADRFEVFHGAVELANGYVELTDADEQAARFERDAATRRELGFEAVTPDAKLLAALSAGLPPAAGVALGFERLHMLAENSDDIRDVVPFPE